MQGWVDLLHDYNRILHGWLAQLMDIGKGYVNPFFRRLSELTVLV